MMDYYELLLHKFKEHGLKECLLNIVQNELLESQETLGVNELKFTNIDALDPSRLSKGDLCKLVFAITSNEHSYASVALKKTKYHYKTYCDKKETSLQEEIRRVILILIYGMTVSYLSPYTALKVDVGQTIWKNSCHSLISKFQSFISSIADEDVKASARLKFHFHGIMNTISQVILIYALLSLKSSVGVSIETELNYKLYWIGFYLCALGDVERYQFHIGDAESDHFYSVRSRLTTELYQLSACLWPKNGKPFHSLAVTSISKEDYLCSLYYYVRSFMCMNERDRSAYSSQDLTTLYNVVHEKFLLLAKELKERPELEFDSCKGGSTDVNVMIVGHRENVMVLGIKDRKRVFLLGDLCAPKLAVLSLSYPKHILELYKFFSRYAFNAFTCLAFSIISRYNLDRFEESLATYLAVVRGITTQCQLSFVLMSGRLVEHCLITIYCVEASLSSNKDDEIDASRTVTLNAAMSLFMGFSSYVTSALVRIEKKLMSDDQVWIYPLKYLALASKWLEMSLPKHQILQDIICCQACNGTVFLFQDLWGVLRRRLQQSGGGQSQNDTDASLIEFKLLFNRMFKFHYKFDSSSPISLLDEKQSSANSYVSFILSSIRSLSKVGAIPFRVDDSDELVLDDTRFSGQQQQQHEVKTRPYPWPYRDPPMSLREFSNTFSGVKDSKSLMLLYGYCSNVEKKEDFSVSQVKYVIPDTNFFLSNASRVLFDNCLDRMTLVISTMVWIELIRIARSPQNRDSEIGEVQLSHARFSVKFIENKLGVSPGSLNFLSSSGNLFTTQTSVICECHDTSHKYDDVILNSVKRFSDENSHSVKFGNQTMNVRYVLFLTNDVVLQTKAMNSDVMCASSDLFTKIIEAMVSDRAD